MKPELEKVHAVFLTETEEQLVTLERDLLTLESCPGPESLRAAFRTVHTLKGGAAVMGLTEAVELAHTLEELLTRLEAGVLVLHSGLGTLLLQAVDAMRELVGLRPVAEPDLRLPAKDVHSLLASTVEAARPLASSAARGCAERLGAESHTETPHRERTLRVGLDRLDRMLDLTGEISIARGRLTSMLSQAHRYSPQQLLEAHREADRLYLDLQELVMKVRMVPIGRTFQTFTRTVRDLCQTTGKLVRLEMSGEDVEVDTTVTELIRDPLTHLVRNAMDHGMEPPEVRQACGKDPTGTLFMRAFHEAGSIVIQVGEDGPGLDRERILERARERGLLGPDEGRPDAELFQFIFEPGFSTAQRVTELSGRGVGMDIVKRNVEMLRGTISLETTPGKGTTFFLRLPLTLSIIEGFSVGVGEETYVIPLEHVVECVELPQLERNPGRTGVFNLRGEPLPYLRLREHLSLGGEPPSRESIVVIGQGRGRAGIAVDTLLGQGQTVIKPLGKPCQGLPGLAGSTLMGDGRVALILDVPVLLQQVLKAASSAAAA
ncbi:chemotaxis protein CheA [Archangium violaceum]|uniref:chemotaxis protein CheA n=1 Tax=Archangium violaceum TaxID=83451 RepID=UPI00193B1F5C|nr:chemotaxis protein CheA [Archangium violaceum]QRK10186.1 chemotaxis protein CheA [Archangium violaceum]